jgi:hypothetical protein
LIQYKLKKDLMVTPGQPPQWKIRQVWVWPRPVGWLCPQSCMNDDMTHWESSRRPSLPKISVTLSFTSEAFWATWPYRLESETRFQNVHGETLQVGF